MVKLKCRAAAFVALCSLLFNSAHAADLLKNGPSVFNYNYAEAVYLNDDNADGIGLRFSADIRENYALLFEYARLSDNGFDVAGLSGGVVYHIEAARFPGRADWVFEAGVVFVDAEGIDDTGVSLGGGVRYAVNDALEVNGMLGLSTVFDTDVTLNLRALYEVSTGFSALLETDLGDGSTLGLGVRFYWR